MLFINLKLNLSCIYYLYYVLTKYLYMRISHKIELLDKYKYI